MFQCPCPPPGDCPASPSGHRGGSLQSLLVPITPTSPPSRDPAGPITCGLLSSPDVLLCHAEDWREPSRAEANATCPGVTYDQPGRQVTLRLGGQEFKSKSLLSATFLQSWPSSPARFHAAFSGALSGPEEVTSAKKRDQKCPRGVSAASPWRPLKLLCAQGRRARERGRGGWATLRTSARLAQASGFRGRRLSGRGGGGLALLLGPLVLLLVSTPPVDGRRQGEPEEARPLKAEAWIGRSLLSYGAGHRGARGRLRVRVWEQYMCPLVVRTAVCDECGCRGAKTCGRKCHLRPANAPRGRLLPGVTVRCPFQSRVQGM